MSIEYGGSKVFGRSRIERRKEDNVNEIRIKPEKICHYFFP